LKKNPPTGGQMRTFVGKELPEEEDEKVTDFIDKKQYKEKIFKVNLPFSRTQSIDIT
jgi:hypothetical protein